ncbi:MAG: precorrin-6y C5,15-methyltransferase (decarboxylating) subunit CbiE [Pseudomonadota bacterium]
MTAWLHVIGIGEDGWNGLRPAAHSALQGAEVIIGGDRHHGLVPELGAERIAWPSPFRAMLDEVTNLRGRKVAILVTGDPLWFSAGRYFVDIFGPDEVAFHPQLSAFQLAAIEMKWSLADVETLTVHGRPSAQIVPYFAEGVRLLVLTEDAGSPSEIAGLLTAHGFGRSTMTVLGALGGPSQCRISGTAATWQADSPDFHVLAVECRAEQDALLLPRIGLPDDAFEHDGKMTKRDVRAATVTALDPRRGQLLWDIGTGCGSVAVEWMRAAPDAVAIGIDAEAPRLEMARKNANRLGAPRLKLLQGHVPNALEGLDRPNAVFLGGGLSLETVRAAKAALLPRGRLVANAVTLESETLLAACQSDYGGELVRLSVSRAVEVGHMRGWRPAMPVTQWRLYT